MVRNVSLRVRMVILWRGRQLACVPTVETGLEKTMQYVQVTVFSVSLSVLVGFSGKKRYALHLQLETASRRP